MAVFFMRKATLQDRQQVIELLSQSFDQNPSVNFVIRQDSRRYERLQALMGYSFDCCYEAGRVYLNEEENTCALVLFHDRKRTTWKSVCRDLKLAINIIGIAGINKVLVRNARIAKQYPVTPFYHLWFIGVLPESQHKGAGSRMLEQLIGESEQMNRPLLLETSVHTNVKWYEQFGFRIYQELDLGYKLYFLRRDV